MGKSYAHVKAMQQPDQTACWSTTMAWWTKAIPSVKNYPEVEIMGMYQHLTGTDGGLKFPDGFKTMIEDAKWGMTVDRVLGLVMDWSLLKAAFKKGPIVCGYWDVNVGGFHAVALYNYQEKDRSVWAMDPNGAQHVNRELLYYAQAGSSRRGIFGYIK